eukprot:scaffold41527_cov63-Phaeocystis_antarctica.AAC.1
MGHAYAMHVPFRAGGAASGGGGEHLVEVVLRLKRRSGCVCACVRAFRDAAELTTSVRTDAAANPAACHAAQECPG